MPRKLIHKGVHRSDSAEGEKKPWGRGLLHLTAFIMALLVSPGLIRNAPEVAQFDLTIFCTACSFLLLTSSILHIPDHDQTANWYRLFRAADHCAIFFFIGASYQACINIPGLDAAAVERTMKLVWVQVVVGVIFAVFLSPYVSKWVRIAPYLTLGWTCMTLAPSFPPLVDKFGFEFFWYLLLGGLFYSFGAVIYARRGPNPIPGVFGFHEVFHVCTLLGMLTHGYHAAYVLAPARAAAAYQVDNTRVEGGHKVFTVTPGMGAQTIKL